MYEKQHEKTLMPRIEPIKGYKSKYVSQGKFSMLIRMDFKCAKSDLVNRSNAL
jgi:hypothetical protein